MDEVAFQEEVVAMLKKCLEGADVSSYIIQVKFNYKLMLVNAHEQSEVCLLQDCADANSTHLDFFCSFAQKRAVIAEWRGDKVEDKLIA